MDFDRVIKEFKLLIGTELKSINDKPLTICGINELNVELQSSSEKTTKWSLSKIKLIVDEMSSGLPVHVDTVLGGGGTKRNYPETLLANLPNVEFLKIDDKKHIVWVKEDTHVLGTKKKMDAEQAELLIKKLKTSHKVPGATVIFCKNLKIELPFYNSFLKTEFQSSDYVLFKKEYGYILLKETSINDLHGKSGPWISVEDDINSFIGSLKDANVTKRIISIKGGITSPEQIVVINKADQITVFSSKEDIQHILK